MIHKRIAFLCMLLPVRCGARPTGRVRRATSSSCRRKPPSLMRYVDYPVSHLTGVPDIRIPLYEIKAGRLTFPY
ncbi:MAG: hypothetical protein ACLR8Y_10185 [Alistipes indistinctus]